MSISVNTEPQIDSSTARDDLVRRLGEDLIGPLSDDETLNYRPTDTYLSGILWPPRSEMGGEEDERLETGSGGNNDGELSAIPITSVQKPSVAGLSFNVLADKKPELSIQVQYARYILAKDDDTGMASWRRKQVNIIIPKFSPAHRSETIKLLQHSADAIGAELYFRSIESGENLLVTISLINNSYLKEDSDRDDREQAAFFQVCVTVRSEGKTRLIPKPQRILSTLELDDVHSDEHSTNLLFRAADEFAVGHVCAATWGEPKLDSLNNAATDFVATTWLPSTIVPGISSTGHRVFETLNKCPEHPDYLSAKFLSTANPVELEKALNSLCRAYELWLDEQYSRVSDLQLHHRKPAKVNLERCGEVLKRMEEATSLMATDEKLRRAFQLSNLAMHVQHGWDPEKSKRGALTWRPFQLAFLLLSAPSTAIRNHADREVMDLLWFPTGGGKTEAYLGLIALVAFYRRLSKEPEDHSGVAAMMRYTLRLLTTQQFSRSAAMILACEAIRKGKIITPDGPILKGNVPFSIGLWVGGDASPNKRAQAYDSLGGASELSSPKQLAICPCCQGKLEWPRIAIDSPIQPRCTTPECSLNGDLPVWTVDEDVYERRPTLLVGTIDKFAQIARKPDTNNLFSVSRGSPPDLILQDELHLISGPLGTVSGLYEAAIDLMFESKGHKAKVIGSTATIRRATEQVRDLFDRDACLFPPPAIDESDSGFSVVDTKSTGRRYVGVSTAGRSAKFTLQAVAASLLQSAAALFDNDADRDPYHTLVGYFNSLRELGGALVLMQDDVDDSVGLIAAARNEDARKAGTVEELTSRRTQDEILQMLNLLSVKAGQAGCIDTVLATNMVSVGVDIPRLGLMIVNGQPKTTAEYIQATSRVGRNKVSGLVVTILNNAKARDRSHFETFCGWHGALYRDVEATSVTPFAARARDKALHAAFVAAVRHLVPGMLTRPIEIESYDSQVQDVIDKIVARASRIDPEEKNVRVELERKLEQWIARMPQTYWNDYKPAQSLMRSAELAARDRALGRTPGSAWATPNSMRNVEAGTPFRLAPYLRKRGNFDGK